MKKLKSVWILLGIFTLCVGCNLLLTKKEIQRSIYSVMRGYQASIKNIEPQVSNQYVNAADLKFVSDSTVNNMHIYIDDKKTATISGVCLFSGYEDPYAGYVIKGKLTYELERSGEYLTACDFSCNADLSGGKVKTLEFSMKMDRDGQLFFDSLVVNGKKREALDQLSYLKKIISAFNPPADF